MVSEMDNDTIVPGLNSPRNEQPPAVYDHFFICGPLSHAVQPVTASWLMQPATYTS